MHTEHTWLYREVQAGVQADEIQARPAPRLWHSNCKVNLTCRVHAGYIRSSWLNADALHHTQQAATDTHSDAIHV